MGSIFGGMNAVGSNTTFGGYLGLGSYIGDDSVVFGTIGKFCSIGHQVIILTGTHPIEFISSSPVFYSIKRQNGHTFVTENQFCEEYKIDGKKGVTVGNDVWIGFGATLKGGIKVGDGAIIGAKAMVTKDVEPYAIIAGNPAKVIRYRFSPSEISFLTSLKWWDIPVHELKHHASKFLNKDVFMDYFKEMNTNES